MYKIILSLLLLAGLMVKPLNAQSIIENGVSPINPFSATINGIASAGAVYSIDVRCGWSSDNVNFNYIQTSPNVITVGMSNQPVSCNLSSLQPSTTYYYRFVIDETPYGGTIVDSTSVKTFTTSALFSNCIFAPNADLGSGIVNVSIEINWPTPNNTTIWYTHGLSAPSALNTASMTIKAGTTNTWEGAINTNFTEQGLRFYISFEDGGSTYYWPSNTGCEYIQVNLTIDTIEAIRKNPAKSQYPLGLADDQWYAYSLPYSFSGTVNLDLPTIFGENISFADDDFPENWSVYEYFPGDTVFENWENTSSMNADKAYFVNHWYIDEQIHLDSLFVPSYISHIRTTDLNWNKTLVQGWNLIPWPFLFVKGFPNPASTSIGNVHTMSMFGDWTTVNDFRPYSAYAIYCYEPTGTTLWDVITLNTALDKPVSNKLKGSDWQIKFNAVSGKRQDYDNGIGVLSGAADGVDFNDQRKPFNIGDNVNLYFPVSQNIKSVPMSYDYRSNNASGHIWDMSVDHTTKNETITLNWEFENLPAGYKAVLVDINNNEFIELNTTDDYTFRASKSNPFKVIAGSSEYVSQKQNQIEKELPDKFTLYANYPNPFNPGTTIKYDLRLASNVKLSVYNTLGQLVRTLVNGAAQTTGTYTVEWDGKDQLGRMASTGVYIYRLDVKDLNGKTFTKSHKMLLIK